MKKVVTLHSKRAEVSVGKIYADLMGVPLGGQVQVVGRPDRVEIYPTRIKLCDICHHPKEECTCSAKK